jgi:hypothetical protein
MKTGLIILDKSSSGRARPAITTTRKLLGSRLDFLDAVLSPGLLCIVCITCKRRADVCHLRLCIPENKHKIYLLGTRGVAHLVLTGGRGWFTAGCVCALTSARSSHATRASKKSTMLWRMLKTMMYQTTCGVALLQRLPLSFAGPFFPATNVQIGADSLSTRKKLLFLFFPFVVLLVRRVKRLREVIN